MSTTETQTPPVAPTAPAPTPERLAAMALQHEVEQFLVDEACALDEWRLSDWLDMCTQDVIYQVPVRVHKEVTGESRVTGVLADSFHLDENRNSLQLRVDRIDTGFAWAEEPPTRIRHLVGNVRVAAGGADDELSVTSNLLLYHTRWDRPEYHVLSAERRDVLRRVDGHLRLARRLAVLDNTVVPTLNISFFL